MEGWGGVWGGGLVYWTKAGGLPDIVLGPWICPIYGPFYRVPCVTQYNVHLLVTGETWLFIEARQGASYAAPCCYFSSLVSVLRFQMSTRDQLNNLSEYYTILHNLTHSYTNIHNLTHYYVCSHTHSYIFICSWWIPTVLDSQYCTRLETERETQRGFQAGGLPWTYNRGKYWTYIRGKYWTYITLEGSTGPTLH